MHSTAKLLTHPAMAALRQAIQQELWLKLTVAVVFIAGGVAGAWYFYKKENLVVMLGMAGVVLGLWFLREYLRRPRVEDDPLWQLLHRQPLQIVWIYTQEERLMPFGMLLSERGRLHVMLLDGGQLTLVLPVEKLRLASKYLHRLLPHATFGYSEERRQQFETDPALLVRG